MTAKSFVLMLMLLSGGVVSSVYILGSCIQIVDTISPENYLAKLNDSDVFGCKNSIRIKPEVLVLGDSHAYTGFDFNILAEELGTNRIATCTLGSMFIESVLYALRYYENLGELPGTVILATSTRQFWNESNKKEMLFSHKAQINAINEGDLVFSLQNVFERIFRQHETAYDDLQHKLRKHTPLIEAMDEQVIAEVLDRTAADTTHLANWRRRIAEAEFSDDVEDMIKEVCQIVSRNGIDLYVVTIPESPWLEKQYPSWIVERYHMLLNSFMPCAKGVYIFSSSDIGLGNRHYINRSLRSDYDYGKWLAPDLMTDANLDADHMGHVGAVIFSREAARAMFGNSTAQ